MHRSTGWSTSMVLLLAGLMLGGAADSQGTKRLASQIHGFPWDGCSDVEGYVLDQDSSITVTAAKCHGVYAAWLRRKSSGSAAGNEAHPASTLDYLKIRDLKSGELFSSGPYCSAAGKEVRWLAIYRWGTRKRITGADGGIREAWVVNLSDGKFERAPEHLIRSVVCTASVDE